MRTRVAVALQPQVCRKSSILQAGSSSHASLGRGVTAAVDDYMQPLTDTTAPSEQIFACRSAVDRYMQSGSRASQRAQILTAQPLAVGSMFEEMPQAVHTQVLHLVQLPPFRTHRKKCMGAVSVELAAQKVRNEWWLRNATVSLLSMHALWSPLFRPACLLSLSLSLSYDDDSKCMCGRDPQAIIWKDKRGAAPQKKNTFWRTKGVVRRPEHELRMHVNGMRMCLDCKRFLPPAMFQRSGCPCP